MHFSRTYNIVWTEVQVQEEWHVIIYTATGAHERRLGPLGVGERRQKRQRCLQMAEEGGRGRQQGQGDHGAGNGQASCPELPRDVWQRVWDLLSFRQLVRRAGVSRDWRNAAAARTAAERAKAAALVTVPESVPDTQLTAAQWVFRAASRILRGLDAFSGEPLGATRGRTYESDKRGTLWLNVGPGSCCLQFRSKCVYAPGFHSGFLFNLHSTERTGHFSCSNLFRATFTLMPHTPRETVWMQGLLLALSCGMFGELQSDGRLPELEGPWKNCNSLCIKWMTAKWELKKGVAESTGVSACNGCTRILRPAELYAPLMRLWGWRSGPYFHPTIFEREAHN